MALDPVTELEALVDALAADHVSYALCGGLALAVYGHPRATKEISKRDPETGELLALDLLVVNPALEAVWAARQTVRAGERSIVVVSREGLAMMKRLAGRRQDLADVAKLEGNDDDEDA